MHPLVTCSLAALLAILVFPARSPAHATGDAPAGLAPALARLEAARDGRCDVPADSLTCRAEAVYWLGREGGPGVPEAIARVLEQDPYTAARIQAARSLGNSRGRSPRTALRKALAQDASPVVRMQAAISLARHGDTAPPVLPVLFAAARGEGMEGWSTWGAYSRRAERDTVAEDKAVRLAWRLEALEAVARIGSPEARALLVSLAGASDPEVARRAADLVRKRKKPKKASVTPASP